MSTAEPVNNNFTVFGIDISRYQGNEISFLTKQTDKLSFVICKATEGITYTDSNFSTNWQAIQTKGYVRGAYHFYHCNDDPAKQAAHYLQTVGSILDTDFPPIVDFEGVSIDPGINSENIQPNLLQFLTLLQQKTGRKPILYTTNNTANKYLTNPEFANFYLWIADYSNSLALPTIWKSTGWILWQKSASYMLDDQLNDFDVFNGDANAFSEFIQSSKIK
ncbi:GH25 family lysozyme [Flavobacterium sp. ABG]|uniref:GH25 family lysozyme n=1 Tax=Flavobacterium sp. ABG TaxID=1423322 RepID=UPI00069CA731|nr:GH25 family lysozyme [Flavobacterium sp. ABG]